MSRLMRKQTTAGYLPQAKAPVADQQSIFSDLQKDFKIEEVLSHSKFLVYKVFSNIHRRTLAMKLFSTDAKEAYDYYNNESRFMNLQHPHIVSYLQKNTKQSHDLKTPYLLMELAHCDFVDLLERVSFSEDEKLVRTYFHQLIEGIEYLHSKGIAHLDIKLENILLGEDFNLKIVDFDTSVKEGDVLKSANTGSLNARAPEIISR
jgi:serine/threonine protein kinase